MSRNGTESPITRYPRVDRWLDLIHLPDEELGRYDVAAVNLACAAGLPGSGVMDVAGCLSHLDKWAVGIANITRRDMAAEFGAHAAVYDNSEPLYRMVKLVIGLQKFCGVVYNQAKIGLKPSDPFDMEDQFVYGAIQGPGGTCATLPVVYAAVGRRLGYPVKLVRTGMHMFCRWDDPTTGVRLNIEGTTHHGVNTHSDDYYRSWPHAITEQEERTHNLLQSLTPRQELANFVQCRAIQWQQHQNYRRAVAASVLAMTIDKLTEGRVLFADVIASEWRRKLAARRPAQFPRTTIVADRARPRWPEVPWKSEMHIRYLEATENMLDDPVLERLWWGPLRRGKPPLSPIATTVRVDCTKEGPCTTNP